MTSNDLPLVPGHSRLLLSMGDLLGRVEEPASGWGDLPAQPGLFLVLWPQDEPLLLRAEAEEGPALRQRWRDINRIGPTDILYIGKADSLRHHIRKLCHFGRGRSTDQKGAKNLWWVTGIEQAGVLMQTCPPARLTAFRNEVLERFLRDHHQLPLANRQGTHGVERWWPGNR